MLNAWKRLNEIVILLAAVVTIAQWFIK